MGEDGTFLPGLYYNPNVKLREQALKALEAAKKLEATYEHEVVHVDSKTTLLKRVKKKQ